MTVKTRETLMQRAMTGKPIMGQELRDLIDTMFWLKASPEQRIAQVVQQVAGRSTPQEPAAFPDLPGTGFVKIGTDRKWFTDPTNYLTQRQGDSFYFRNSLFPMDPSLYLAGDRTFKNFTDSARAAFTGGDGIDITLGDIAVDNTVSRVGHQHALTLSGDVSGSGIVAGTIATTVNAIRGGVVPPPGSAGYFYWTGSSYSWVATPPPNTIALDDLADVALASVTAGQVLWYDGSVGQWINKMLGANDIPAHASRHHSGGSDPLAGQSIAGLLTSSYPTFAGLNLLTASAGTLTDLSFRSATNLRRFVIRWDNPNDYLELFTNNDDGSPRHARMLIPRSSSLPIRMYSGVTITGTTTLDTSLSGMLKATAGVVSVAGAADVPAHATRHHWDGTDPITGQLLAGLLPNDVPVFSGLRSGSVTGYFPIRGNTGVEIARFNSSGFISYGDITLSGDLSIANLSGILYAANGRVRVAIGSDLPAHSHLSFDISDSGNAGRTLLQQASIEDARSYLQLTGWATKAFTNGSTSDVAEGTNLYYTDARARAAITASDPINVTNGHITHVNTDGYKHVPATGTASNGQWLRAGPLAGSAEWTTLLASHLPLHVHSVMDIGDSGTIGVQLMYAEIPAGARSILELTGWATKAFTNGSTTDVAEGTNLYYTDARARAAITATTPIIATAGVISHSTADGNLHVPATGTTNNGKWLKAGATAGAFSWQALTAGDLPGGASTLAGLANGDGCLRNTGAGVLSWTPVFPIKSYSSTGLGNFGGSGQPSAPALLSATDNMGIGLADGRSLSWRAALVSSDSIWGLWQDASLSSSLKDFVIGDGTGAIWYRNSPLGSSFKHFFTGNTQLSAGLVVVGQTTLATSLTGMLKATAGVVAVVGAAGIDPGLVNVPYGRIPFGGSSGLTYSDKLRFNDPYTDLLWVDSDVDIRGTVYANDLQLPLDGSIVSYSAALIQFGDGISVPRVLFPNVATNKAFQVDGLATFAHISAYLLEGDVQADRDEIESNGTRTLPEATAAMVGKERRFCAGVGPSTYTVSVNTPASEVIRYRSRTTGLPLTATSLDIVDSATTFVCHAVGRWTAIGY